MTLTNLQRVEIEDDVYHWDVLQGSGDWERLRIGIPTASEFNRILTAGGAAVARSASVEFATKLVAEIMMDRPIYGVETPWMERGKIEEQQGAVTYQLVTGRTLTKAGFVTNKAHTYGASVDRFVDDDGILEIKCPKENTHVRYLWEKKLAKKYTPQLQGQLFVTKRKWVDIISYHPEMPPVIMRVEADPKYQAKFKTRMEKFRELMGDIILDLQKEGVYDFAPKTFD